jgi:hypothetical protein
VTAWRAIADAIARYRLRMTSEPGPAQKLASLLETLEPADRQEVTAWLLGRGTRGWMLRATAHRDLVPGPDVLAGRDLATGLVSGENSQLVTVRLPAAQHERLREWCTEHTFTMAAVVRGLIERFLDGQQRPARP